METKGPEKNSTEDLREFVQDLTARWRYLHKLEKDLNVSQEAGNSAETHALGEEFAKLFAEVMCREHFLEICRQNGENIPTSLSRPSGSA
jgi:hypothetical protein